MRLVAQGDWVVDIGPGAGRDGGKIVAEGRPEEVANAKAGRTAGVFGEGARPREGSDRAEGCGTAAVIADRESFSDFAMSYCVRESVSITLAVSPKPEKAPSLLLDSGSASTPAGLRCGITPGAGPQRGTGSWRINSLRGELQGDFRCYPALLRPALAVDITLKLTGRTEALVDPDFLLVVLALATFFWMLGEWLCAVFRAGRSDQFPGRFLTALVSALPVWVLLTGFSNVSWSQRVLVAAAVPVAYCFVFIGPDLTRRGPLRPLPTWNQPMRQHR